MKTSNRAVALACWLSLGAWGTLQADVPRVLPEGQRPQDARLEPLKDLDGYFPMNVPGSAAEWEKRAEQVRRRILVSMGLWPAPTKTALNPVIHGLKDLGDYTVEKVYFESVPGFYVTGSLYRPKKVVAGKTPAVLCPHGHWNNGRFTDAGADGVKREVAQGAERFIEGGRSPLQARCVQLARMGCVVFHYDMVGYADSVQIPMSVAHTFARQRPEMNRADGWGLFSPQAESHLQSVMMLQTWNSIRSLDFLLTLPEVDPDRIGCTGASGGGTQTFILGAIDPRVKWAFPAVMVSTAMQGGCTCENASLLRVGTGNIEFAGLFAPRPMGMTSANDWTREVASKGFPELQRLYALLGAKDNVQLSRGEHFGHNYNSVARTAMYSSVNRHFKLGHAEPILEEDYRRLSAEEMTVWDASHPTPAGGPEFERKLLRHLKEDRQRALKETTGTPDGFRRVVGGGLDVVIGRSLDDVGAIDYEQKSKADHGSWLQIGGLLRNKAGREELPVVFCHPKEWNGATVVWLTEDGKGGLFFPDGALRPEPKKLVAAGATVVGVDLLHQGEFQADGKRLVRTGRVKNPREVPAYTFGYNSSVFAQRVHDVLSVIRFVKNHERKSSAVCLLATDGSGPIAAAARAQARGAVDVAAIDTGGFRFLSVNDVQSPDFLPGGAAYYDVPGMLALGAPGKTWVAGEKSASLGVASTQYAAANSADALSVYEGSPEMGQAAAVTWVLSQIKR